VTALQQSLFEPSPELPPGMVYQADVISKPFEQRLVELFATLPLRPFEFVGGLKGERKVKSYGLSYDWSRHRLQAAEAIPQELKNLRDLVAPLAALRPQQLRQVLITQYEPGAGIGWHKDRPQFAEVIGASLLSPCLFRFRKKIEGRWKRRNLTIDRRSVYVLSGPSRTVWEHSIPPVEALRFSVTFRSLVFGPIS
jgi:alkylated DNA repair dioxygenase AlkB